MPKLYVNDEITLFDGTYQKLALIMDYQDPSLSLFFTAMGMSIQSFKKFLCSLIIWNSSSTIKEKWRGNKYFLWHHLNHRYAERLPRHIVENRQDKVQKVFCLTKEQGTKQNLRIRNTVCWTLVTSNVVDPDLSYRHYFSGSGSASWACRSGSVFTSTKCKTKI